MSESSGEQWLREGACQSIQKYRAGKITLRSLVADLNIISLELEETPLGEDLRSHWWNLEQIYAVAHIRGELQELPREYELDIQETLDALERLLSKTCRREYETSRLDALCRSHFSVRLGRFA